MIHTPGPWTASKHSEYPDRDYEVTTPDQSIADVDTEDNARLVAAAPELFASHEKLLQWLSVVLDQVDYTSGACGLTEMVGACLEKSVIENARDACQQALKVKYP